mgnify:CR=1 FL=1
MLNTEEMGKRIKELRIEKGWTGIKMSTKIGVDQSYYSKIEKGKHEIKLEKLYEIEKKDTNRVLIIQCFIRLFNSKNK